MMNVIKLILKWVGILFGLMVLVVIGVAIIGNIQTQQERQEQDARQKAISAKKIVSPPAAPELTPEEKEKKMFREAEERGRQRRRLEQQSTISADKEETCKKLGPFARAVAEMRQKGVSLQVAEAGIEISLGEHTTPDGLKFAKDIVRSVYANQLTTENAAEITIESCKVMVFASELEKNRK